MTVEVNVVRFRVIGDNEFVFIVHGGQINSAKKKLQILMYAVDKKVLPSNCFMMDTGVLQSQILH